MTEQDKTSTCKELVIISPSLLHWNLSDFVYHPEFDLGIGEKWLPKHPIARVSTSIDVLNQDGSTNDDDTEFWQSIGAIEDNKLIEVITDEQPVPLLEVSSALEPKQSKKQTYFRSPKPVEWMQSSLNYCCRYSYQEPRSNWPLKDTTNSSTLLQPRLQRFSKPVSSPEREKAGEGVNIDQDTQSCVSSQESRVAHKCVIYRNR